MNYDDKLEQKAIANMFYAVGKMCERLNEQTKMRILDLNNPKWGVECETKDKKYQLVLELKEVEKWVSY